MAREKSEIIRVSKDFANMVKEAAGNLGKTSAEITNDIANRMKRKN